MTTTTTRRSSWWHRLNCTPLRDVVRGRLTARLDIAAIIAAAGLPAELAAIVRTVARSTRLSRLEKADVATELAAHFQDGLAAGVRAKDLVAAFGDAKQAARLIRRAKLRSRPMCWKLARGVKRALQLVFVLALLVYAVQAVRLYSHAPNVARNYVAEWNTASLSVPEVERAWPVYREAFLAETEACPDFGPKDWSAGGARWGEVIAYVTDNAPALERYRQAASRPDFGAVLSAVSDAEVEERLGWRTSPGSAEPNAPEIPYFMAVHTPQFGVLREAGRLLTLDARVAAAAGDSDRVLRDIEAALDSVGHGFQMRMLIGDLSGLAVANLTLDVMGGLLHDHAGLFSDSQLLRLSHRLAALGGRGDMQVDLASEYAMFEDVLQRFYTDDGHGDGLPTADAFQLVGSTTNMFSWSIGGQAAKIAAPAFSVVIAGRHEIEGKFRELLARNEAEARVPLWARGASEVDQEIVRLSASPLSKLRYLVIVLFFSSYSSASVQSEYPRQTRDATLVAMALELYRRRTGTWPASLDELTPQFLPQVPPDRYDGKPIKYRLVDGEPLLYSIGVNRVDDGGRLPDARWSDEMPVYRNVRARNWQPPGSAQPPPDGVPVEAPPDGDWILWPPVEN
jgi:hypothetical protein